MLPYPLHDFQKNTMGAQWWATMITSFQFYKAVRIIWFYFGKGDTKVIIEKSCSEVSLMEQDTNENVSEPISFFFLLISYIFDTSKCATNYIISFEVYIWWFHRSKDFVAMKAGKLAIWPKSSPNLNSCTIKISHRGTSL